MVASIRQGATIVPHVLTLVATREKARRRGWARVTTQRSKHKPWRLVPSQEGLVPEYWIWEVHTSPDMLPFVAKREPPRAIIPVDADGSLQPEPGRTSKFWSELDEIWDAERTRGRSTPDTLMGRLDFSSALSSQHLKPQRGRRMVLYPSSADIMRACARPEHTPARQW